MGMILTLAGLLLLVAGLVVILGAPAAVACGLLLALAGVFVDWEKAT